VSTDVDQRRMFNQTRVLWWAKTLLLAVLGGLLGGCLTNPNQPPTLLRGDALEFPQAARDEGLTGEVRVRYDVTAQGRVVNAVVVRAQPADVFNEAALDAVRGWRFRPGRIKGEPSTFSGLTSTLEFRFGESDDYPTR